VALQKKERGGSSSCESHLYEQGVRIRLADDGANDLKWTVEELGPPFPKTLAVFRLSVNFTLTMPESSATSSETSVSSSKEPVVSGTPRPTRLKPKVLKLVRRLHLYFGLFLLPWVFLYGITGAMYNHMGLFPAVEIQNVPSGALADSALKNFPEPEVLAGQVVAELRKAAPGSTIALNANHGAAFNNDLMLETWVDGEKKVVHFNPVDFSAKVVTPPDEGEKKAQTPMLNGVKNVRVEPNPHRMAEAAALVALKAAGLGGGGRFNPVGWCKLNFLADIDGETARVTYVLRDGHVDVTKFTGEDGMNTRQFFLRMHSFHGRGASWSARNLWSLFIDLMAFAMVMWGVTGIVMWWQLKSVRVVGGIVLILSVIVATMVALGLENFHAMTRM